MQATVLSLLGDTINTLEYLVMDKKYSTFSNSFCLLEDKASWIYEAARTTRIIPWK